MAKIGVKTSSKSVNILIFMHSIKKVIIGLTVQKNWKIKEKNITTKAVEKAAKYYRNNIESLREDAKN